MTAVDKQKEKSMWESTDLENAIMKNDDQLKDMSPKMAEFAKKTMRQLIAIVKAGW